MADHCVPFRQREQNVAHFEHGRDWSNVALSAKSTLTSQLKSCSEISTVCSGTEVLYGRLTNPERIRADRLSSAKRRRPMQGPLLVLCTSPARQAREN